MKISFLCLAIYAYVVYASEGSGESETKHAVQYNVSAQGYVPYGSYPVTPPPGYYPPRHQPPPQRSGGLNLSNPIVLCILLMALTPKTTTTTDATTMAPVTTAAPDPLAGWTKFGDNNCYYMLSDTTATWTAAKTYCEGAIEEGRLAVVGFNQPSSDRTALMTALGAVGVTFWIGVDGTSGMRLTGMLDERPVFIDPLNGADPTGEGYRPTGLDVELVAGTADGDVCGRVDSASLDLLLFEDCDTTARRYMCEVCM